MIETVIFHVDIDAFFAAVEISSTTPVWRENR